MVMTSTYGVSAQNVRDAAFGITIPVGQTVDDQLDRLIEKAELQLPQPCVQRRIDSGALDVAEVKSIIEDMVVRVAKNPKGYRQRSIDDFQVTIDTALSSGALRLTDEERLRLCPPSPTGRVGSVRIAVPAWRAPYVR